ncbi:hypothetical protein BDAP_002121 [Binucleata daphniae]
MSNITETGKLQTICKSIIEKLNKQYKKLKNPELAKFKKKQQNVSTEPTNNTLTKLGSTTNNQRWSIISDEDNTTVNQSVLNDQLQQFTSIRTKIEKAFADLKIYVKKVLPNNDVLVHTDNSICLEKKYCLSQITFIDAFCKDDVSLSMCKSTIDALKNSVFSELLSKNDDTKKLGIYILKKDSKTAITYGVLVAKKNNKFIDSIINTANKYVNETQKEHLKLSNIDAKSQNVSEEAQTKEADVTNDQKVGNIDTQNVYLNCVKYDLNNSMCDVTATIKSQNIPCNTHDVKTSLLNKNKDITASSNESIDKKQKIDENCSKSPKTYKTVFDMQINDDGTLTVINDPNNHKNNTKPRQILPVKPLRRAKITQKNGDSKLLCENLPQATIKKDTRKAINEIQKENDDSKTISTNSSQAIIKKETQKPINDIQNRCDKNITAKNTKRVTFDIPLDKDKLVNSTQQYEQLKKVPKTTLEPVVPKEKKSINNKNVNTLQEVYEDKKNTDYSFEHKTNKNIVDDRYTVDFINLINNPKNMSKEELMQAEKTIVDDKYALNEQYNNTAFLHNQLTNFDHLKNIEILNIEHLTNLKYKEAYTYELKNGNMLFIHNDYAAQFAIKNLYDKKNEHTKQENEIMNAIKNINNKLNGNLGNNVDKKSVQHKNLKPNQTWEILQDLESLKKMIKTAFIDVKKIQSKAKLNRRLAEGQKTNEQNIMKNKAITEDEENNINGKIQQMKKMANKYAQEAIKTKNDKNENISATLKDSFVFAKELIACSDDEHQQKRDNKPKKYVTKLNNATNQRIKNSKKIMDKYEKMMQKKTKTKDTNIAQRKHKLPKALAHVQSTAAIRETIANGRAKRKESQ